MHSPAIARAASALLVCAACSQDPRYVEPEDDLTAGPETPATGELVLPIRLEEEVEAEDRGALAEELGIDVPYVNLDDMQISLEWTIENLDEEAGEVRIHVNGANEYFSYVPLNFVVDPEEEPPPPPLLGDVPLPLPGSGTISGVFREDQFREAAIDLELITRGGVNPFAAMLEYHANLDEVPGSEGATIPSRAFASLVRLDLALISTGNARMRYAVRVRSKRLPNLIHDEGASAPEGELTVFAPVEFLPPAPADPGN